METGAQTCKGKLAYSPVELAEGRADPFDHLLVAQALSEQSILVTADASIINSEHETLKAI